MLPGLVFAQGATVILVSDNPSDFAVATLLAEKLDLDIAVTPWGTLSNESVRQIKASKYKKVYVIGGFVAVPGAEDALEQRDITIERVAGADRYETSALVAEKWDSSSKIFIAGGYDEQGIGDALKKAKPEKAPMVFVKAKEVPQEVTNITARLNVSEAVLIPAPDMNITEINASLRAKGVNVDIIQLDFEKRAQSAIYAANLTISDAEASIGEIADAKSVAAFRLLEKAKEHFGSAQEALEAGGYGEAFSRGVAAREDAENSIRILSGVLVGDLQKAVEKAKAEIEALVIGMNNIGDIMNNPAGYEGKDVQITGDVITEPIFIIDKTYIDMRDETGRILIRKEGFAGPPSINTGDRIKVTGKVRLNVLFGGGHNVIPYLIEATDIRVIST